MIKSTTHLNHLRSGVMEIDVNKSEEVDRSFYHLCAFEEVKIKLSGGLGHQQMASFSKIEDVIKSMGLRISFDVYYPVFLGSNFMKVSHMISTFKNYPKVNSIWLNYDHIPINKGKDLESVVKRIL